MDGNLPPQGETRGPLLLEYIWIGVGFSTIFIAARAFTRITVSGGLKLDDYLMGLALLSGIIVGVLTTISVNLGFGAHIFYLSNQQASEAIRYQYIIEPLSYLALVLGRVSFAVSLLKIIGVTKLRRRILYSLIIGQVVINLIMVGIQLGQCDPIAKYWNPSINGKCLNPLVIEYAGYMQGSWNIFTDFALALLPAIVISNLNLGFRTKLGLVILMSLGIFNMVAAIVTLVEITRIGGSRDITYDYVLIAIWGIVQTYLAIIVASIPFIYPLFRNSKLFTLSFYNSLLGRTSSKSKSKPSNHRIKDDGYSTNSGESGSSASPPTPCLPNVKRDRFATTTLWNAGKSHCEAEADEEQANGAGVGAGARKEKEGFWTHRAGIEYSDGQGAENTSS